MKHFLLNAMAVADASRGLVERRPLPEEVLRSEKTTRLSELFPDAVVIAAGSLTGSFAPASGLLTAFADGKKTFLTGHTGRALRLCGLDALVITGRADAPKGLVLDDRGGAFIPADASKEAPALRDDLVRAARACPGVAADGNPLPLVTGPAAFAGCASACLLQETGTAPRSAALALALAERNIAGLCFCGDLGFVSPVPADTPLRAAVPAQRVSRSNLAALLSAAGGAARADAVTPGRSLACFACPAPCGFWMNLGKGFVPCTEPEALAALLSAGATEARAAEILALGGKFGTDPLALVSLASAGALPDSLEACTAAASPLPEETRDADLDAMAEEYGICPFFLKRFPAAAAALRAVQDEDDGN